MRPPQPRQRPRRTRYESTGTLSYHAIGVAQTRHAEPGLTIDRRSGTRAATTLRKLPIASPGTTVNAAANGLTSVRRAVGSPQQVRRRRRAERAADDIREVGEGR